MLPPPIPPVSWIFAFSLVHFVLALGIGWVLTDPPKGLLGDLVKVGFAGAIVGSLKFLLLGLLLLP